MPSAPLPSAEPLKIYAEDTPNPLSNKFNVNRTLLSGPARDFPNRLAAAGSALATELFQIPGVSGVFVGADFVTVTILPGNSWWVFRPLVEQSLTHFVQSGADAVQPGGASADAGPQRMYSAQELGILKILEEEIRPAVAMDGGDISFVSYENKIVKLHLRGACHSCPSSTITLRNGIEHRLRQAYPEIEAVQEV
jgi:Fe-S cluster biogenesis protein NfuA